MALITFIEEILNGQIYLLWSTSPEESIHLHFQSVVGHEWGTFVTIGQCFTQFATRSKARLSFWQALISCVL